MKDNFAPNMQHLIYFLRGFNPDEILRRKIKLSFNICYDDVLMFMVIKTLIEIIDQHRKTHGIFNQIQTKLFQLTK